MTRAGGLLCAAFGLTGCAPLGLGSWGYVEVVNPAGDPIEGVNVTLNNGSVHSGPVATGADGWAKIEWSFWVWGGVYVVVTRDDVPQGGAWVESWPMRITLSSEPRIAPRSWLFDALRLHRSDSLAFPNPPDADYGPCGALPDDFPPAVRERKRVGRLWMFERGFLTSTGRVFLWFDPFGYVEDWYHEN